MSKKAILNRVHKQQSFLNKEQLDTLLTVVFRALSDELREKRILRIPRVGIIRLTERSVRIRNYCWQRCAYATIRLSRCQKNIQIEGDSAAEAARRFRNEILALTEN